MREPSAPAGPPCRPPDARVWFRIQRGRQGGRGGAEPPPYRSVSGRLGRPGWRALPGRSRSRSRLHAGGGGALRTPRGQSWGGGGGGVGVAREQSSGDLLPAPWAWGGGVGDGGWRGQGGPLHPLGSHCGRNWPTWGRGGPFGEIAPPPPTPAGSSPSRVQRGFLFLGLGVSGTEAGQLSPRICQPPVRPVGPRP